MIINYHVTGYFLHFLSFYFLVVFDAFQVALDTIHPALPLTDIFTFEMQHFVSLEHTEDYREERFFFFRNAYFFNVFYLNSIQTSIHVLILIEIEHSLLQLEIHSFKSTAVKLVSV